jgi:hypothetical protein
MAASQGDGGVLEFPRSALSGLLLAVGACRGDQEKAAALPVPGEGPGAPRVTVEVLNASGKPGLARTAVRVLRRAGIDVITFGTAPASLGTLDSTRIAVQRAAPGVGQRVRRALGVGRVEIRLDSTRLLDARVLLGADFAPPRLEFHP